MKRLVRSGEPTLAWELHRPTAPAKGAILLTHGYGEHSDRYLEAIETFNAAGFYVGRYDVRGHGDSEGVRGHVMQFSSYVEDAHAVLGALAKEDGFRDQGPPILLGHSHGGLISFHVAAGDQGSFRGLLMTSPFFGLALEVPAAKKAAGRLMSRVWPSLSLPSGLQGKDMTHDAELAAKYDRDQKMNKGATARWFTECTAAQARALELAPQLMLPVTVFHGSDDKVASPAASKALFDRIGSATKRYEVVPGQYHELFNEVDRKKWVASFVDAALAMLPA